MRRANHLAEAQKQRKKGTDGIASLAESSKKRLKLGEHALFVEREKSEAEQLSATLKLFEMEGTEKAMKITFIKAMQKNVLADVTNSSRLDAGTATPVAMEQSPKDAAGQPVSISTNFATD